MTHPGAKPLGAELVERLEGSGHAKERLKVMLLTLSGELTIPAACQRLGIHETRFHVQRATTLQAALGSLEPRPAGRPPQVLSAEEQRIAELEAQLGEARLDLQAAQIRLEHTQILRGDRAGGSSQ
jgi:predicted ArsR family transcriptional regulator